MLLLNNQEKRNGIRERKSDFVILSVTYTHISESSFKGHTLVTGRLGALERGKELSPKGKGSWLGGAKSRLGGKGGGKSVGG